MGDDLDCDELARRNTTSADRFWGRTVGLWLARLKEVPAYIAAFRSPFRVLARVKKSGPWPVEVTLRSGNSISLASSRDASMFAHSAVSHEFHMTRLEKLGTEHTHFEFQCPNRSERATLDLPSEVGDPGIFLSGEYDHIDVRGRSVVDIGAGAGESAVYFALHGATHVFAYEPFPVAYQYALANVNQNPTGCRMVVERKAVGGRVAEVLLLGSGTGTATNRALSGARGDVRTPVTTLEEIALTHGIADGILKVDCEGDEYEILLSAPRSVLQHFRSIVIEYHHGFNSLRSHLRNAGFRVRTTRPVFSPKSLRPMVYYGLLTAHRIG